jgi:hypothetical protein
MLKSSVFCFTDLGKNYSIQLKLFQNLERFLAYIGLNLPPKKFLSFYHIPEVNFAKNLKYFGLHIFKSFYKHCPTILMLKNNLSLNFFEFER